MSQNYSARSRNPFETDDSEYKFGNRNETDQEQDIRQIREKIGRVENDSLESTYRALRTLNETHEVGVKTADELVRQGEKLNNVNERLDEVNNTLTTTQKNLNQIKSVFGGLKNKFFSKSSASKTEVVKSDEKLKASVSANSLKSFNQPKAEFVEITGSDREKDLNKNLDEMSLGLKRLANLGMDMRFELDRQNNLIEKISDKTNTTDIRINDQNTQMRKILK